MNSCTDTGALDGRWKAAVNTVNPLLFVDAPTGECHSICLLIYRLTSCFQADARYNAQIHSNIVALSRLIIDGDMGVASEAGPR
jgi:hypothetical protein